MIKLIVGNKGSGKTKTLIDMINAAVKTTAGNIVCVEKGLKMTYDIDHAVRLIDIEEYKVEGYDAFYGFLAGIFAGNYDISEIFVDGTLKIGGRNYDEFAAFIERLQVLLDVSKAEVTFTVSCDVSELPENVKKYIVD
ncbi:hypothetical protein H8711_04750 [Clostridiaceae bacterium NSJ-31]|uniref:Twitching motility protein PilT n=1 Tax=Ligaoa zhengdingensis TaxID=2763658 RepID=A0A926I4C1_9FIRM|nr:type IV pilus twitching motility protein PilT [Ligaoa zhengdingensis]MBC8546245.1 hypothetical protein [Ligaoa zhengdingensis]